METPNETTWPAAPAEQTPAEPDVATQPVAPSESAGTQEAAGSPSEQSEAAVAVPPSAPTDGAQTVPPAGPETQSAGIGLTQAELETMSQEELAARGVSPGGAQVNPTAPASQPAVEPAPQPTETLPPESPAAEPGLTARPAGVGVDGAVYRGRDDNDAVTDRFCRVVSGPYAGRYGVYLSTASLGADGWPETIVVRTRDAEDENLVVDYADCRPDTPGKR